MAALPMFPLGSVLFPGAVLPLHVFEPRYRRLVQDCVAGDQEFGVVLIERGSEVGGGDLRTSVGCVAQLAQVAALEDGRFAVIGVGTRRIRVTAWLDDDPYPRADVEDWPDEPPAAGFVERLDVTIARLRRVLALQAELGQATTPATVELSDDPLLASYHAAAIAPLGPADQFDLLAAAGPEERIRRLDALLDDAQDVAELLLAQSSPPPPDVAGDEGPGS